MHNYSHEIIEKFMVRKNKKQKVAFITRTKEVMETEGYSVKIEEGGVVRNRNIVVGDIERAQVIYTAHYDTCAVLPFPNFITPRNWVLFLLYQIFISFMIFGVAEIIGFLVYLITHNELAGIYVTLGTLLVFCYQIMAGVANKNTYNDNTSGVVTLVEFAMNLPVELRDKVAVVFFDNEELGLFGSLMFYKMHHKVLKEKLIVNMDCVSDGDHFLVVANRQAKKDDVMYPLVKECLSSNEEKQVKHTTAASTFYPSDQLWFRKYIPLAAMHKAPLVGYYMGRIHTSFDTKFDERNITLLSKSIISLTKKIEFAKG